MSVKYLIIERYEDGTNSEPMEFEKFDLSDLIDLSYEIIIEIQERVNGL